MKVLNLYAGLGGNRHLWTGVDVVAVELQENIAEAYQRQYPSDVVIVADAHQYLLDNYDRFDFVWSSPPCQSHSRMMKFTRHRIRKFPDMKLYEEILFLQSFCKGGFVVENVLPYYQPLIAPTRIIGRHAFWSNYNIPFADLPESPKGFITGAKDVKRALVEWLGIDYSENIYYSGNHCPQQVLRNCVHPLVGLHVFNSFVCGSA